MLLGAGSAWWREEKSGRGWALRGQKGFSRILALGSRNRIQVAFIWMIVLTALSTSQWWAKIQGSSRHHAMPMMGSREPKMGEPPKVAEVLKTQDLIHCNAPTSSIFLGLMREKKWRDKRNCILTTLSPRKAFCYLLALQEARYNCSDLECHPEVSCIHVWRSDWTMGHCIVIISGLLHWWSSYISMLLGSRAWLEAACNWGCAFGRYTVSTSPLPLPSLFPGSHGVSTFPPPYPSTMMLLTWSQQTKDWIPWSIT